MKDNNKEDELMDTIGTIDKNQPVVLEHIRLLQSIIARMSEFSSRCKTWCVTLTSALLVVMLKGEAGDTGKMVPLCYTVISLFFFLDSYYLGIERSFRNKLHEFLDGVNQGKEDIDKPLLDVGNRWGSICEWLENMSSQLVSTLGGLLSFAVWPFYVVLYVALYCFF